MMAPFRLYGLLGCQHCKAAEDFMRDKRLPCEIIIANNDPIIDDGVIARTGGKEARYPVLLSRITNEIVAGWKPEDYERLDKAFAAQLSAGNPSVFGGGQLVDGQAPPTPAQNPAGAN
jgi:glutaredoxin